MEHPSHGSWNLAEKRFWKGVTLGQIAVAIVTERSGNRRATDERDVANFVERTTTQS